jgi:hypothetical protein
MFAHEILNDLSHTPPEWQVVAQTTRMNLWMLVVG